MIRSPMHRSPTARLQRARTLSQRRFGSPPATPHSATACLAPYRRSQTDLSWASLPVQRHELVGPVCLGFACPASSPLELSQLLRGLLPTTPSWPCFVPLPLIGFVTFRAFPTLVAATVSGPLPSCHCETRAAVGARFAVVHRPKAGIPRVVVRPVLRSTFVRPSRERDLGTATVGPSHIGTASGLLRGQVRADGPPSTHVACAAGCWVRVVLHLVARRSRRRRASGRCVPSDRLAAGRRASSSRPVVRWRHDLADFRVLLHQSVRTGRWLSDRRCSPGVPAPPGPIIPAYVRGERRRTEAEAGCRRALENPPGVAGHERGAVA